MGALAADKRIDFFGVPQKYSFKADVAATYYAGGLVFHLAAGNVSKVPVAGCTLAGISTKTQVVAAGGEVECFIGPFIASFPLLTGATIADEDDQLVMDASGTLSDNPSDCVSAGDAVLADNDILIGRILRVFSDHVDIQLFDHSSLRGIASTQAATVSCFR